MKATARISGAWLGAALCLLLAAGPPAWGQNVNVVTVDSGTALSLEVDQSNLNFDRGDITLDSSGPLDGIFDAVGGMTVTRNVTIRGDGDLPTEATITATNASSTGATILVERGARLSLQNLTITSVGNFPAIKVMAGGELVLERVLVEDSGAEGVLTVDEVGVTDPATITVTSSIFNNNGNEAIRNEARNADIHVFQSTFLGNSGGVRHNQTNAPVENTGAIIVAASIFDNTGTPLASNNSELEIESWANALDTSVGPNVRTEGDPITDSPSFVSTSPAFPGNVDTALFSGLAFGQLPPTLQNRVSALWIRDFKKLPRSFTNLQIGADEIGGVTGPSWLDVSVRYLDQEDQYIGPNKPAVIRVAVNEIDLSNGRLIIVPELGNVNDPDTYIILNGFTVVVPDETYDMNFVVPGTFSLGDPTVPVDGLATIFLVDNNGEVYGDDAADPLGPAIQDDGQGATNARRQFIIDTIAPALFQSSDRTEELVVFSPEDTTLAQLPAGAFDFPAAWEPGNERIPRSAVLWATGNPRVFTNAVSPMALTVGVRFVEVFPELPDGTVVGVETSGFQGLSLNLDDLTEADQRNIVYPPTLTRDYHGIAYLQPTSDDIDSGNAAIAHIADTDTDADGLTRPVIDARWTFGLQVHNPGWRRDFQFAAIDRAGNIATASNEAEVYWLRNPVAQLTGPGDVETSNPEFNWTVAHGGAGVVAPTNVAPSQPIARFSLWRARDVTQQVWDNIMPWSQWQFVSVINRNTVLFPNVGRFGAFLDRPDAQGQVLALLPQVADQAGNLTDPGVGLNENATPSRFDLESRGAAIWATPGFAATVDTNLQAFFWHNRVDGGNLRAREPGEPFFGAATRIPLPAIDECFFRVEAAFTIGYELSDRQPPAGSFPFSNFQLFEDGRLVASGTIQVPLDTFRTSLVIPQDLFLPPPGTVFNETPQNRTAFLNNASGECFEPNVRDRLGDEGIINEQFPERGNRYRDVTYTLEVQNGYEQGGTGVVRLDPTPASFTWVVSVDTPLGDEQPIKSFGRE